MNKYIIIALIVISSATGVYLINQNGNIANNQKEVETVTIESKDETTDTIYSTLKLDFPNGAIDEDVDLQVTSQAGSQYDQYLGGAYHILPENIELLKPVTVSITYTEEALSVPVIKDFSDSELTLACWDNDSLEYVPIESNFDKESKTVSAQVTELCSQGLTIVEKQ